MISEQLHTFKQKVDKTAMENAVIVIVVVRYILPDYDLLEEVLCEHKRGQFGIGLVLGVHSQRRLDIYALVGIVDHEVDLLLHIPIVGTVSDYADVNGIAPAKQLVINDVLHKMPGVELPVIEPCVPEPHIGVIILVRVLEIGLALDIVSLGFGDQERVHNMPNIIRHECGVYLLVFHTCEGIRDIRRIGQRAYL